MRQYLYWCDGHYISATTAKAAARECERRYGHSPETVKKIKD